MSMRQPKAKSTKSGMTQEKRDEIDRERQVMKRARQIQREEDNAKIKSVVPAVCEAIFEQEEDDDDGGFTVEYSEEWNRRGFPVASLIVKSTMTFCSADAAKKFISLAEGLGMTGSFQTSRELDYEGQAMIFFSLRPQSNKRNPSDEAIELAKTQLAAEAHSGQSS